MHWEIQWGLQAASNMVVAGTRQATMVLKVVDMRCIARGVCRHPMAGNCGRRMMGLRVGWRSSSDIIWKLENDLLRLGGVYVNVKVVLRCANSSISNMLEMLHMWGMLIGASRQRCLMDVRWVDSTLRIILMHLRDLIVLHVAASTLLRVTWNVMMDMRMNNVASTILLSISDLIIYLNASLLLVLSIVVALLVFIRDQLWLTINFSLSILARLKATEEWARMIARSIIALVLISWRLNLGSDIRLLLLLPFHDVLKKLHTFLHAVSLLRAINSVRLTSQHYRCIWLMADRGRRYHLLAVDVLLTRHNIHMLLFLVESLLVCASLIKELFLLRVCFHLCSLFNLPLTWWLYFTLLLLQYLLWKLLYVLLQPSLTLQGLGKFMSFGSFLRSYHLLASFIIWLSRSLAFVFVTLEKIDEFLEVIVVCRNALLLLGTSCNSFFSYQPTLLIQTLQIETFKI